MPRFLGEVIPTTIVIKAIEDHKVWVYNKKQKKYYEKFPRRIKIKGFTYTVTPPLRTFYYRGTDCSVCGLKGLYYQQVRTREQDRWFLVLFGKINGKGIPITQNHIIPRIAGGSRWSLKNMQVLCEPCNTFKGDMVPSALPLDLQQLQEQRLSLIHISEPTRPY